MKQDSSDNMHDITDFFCRICEDWAPLCERDIERRYELLTLDEATHPLEDLLLFADDEACANRNRLHLVRWFDGTEGLLLIPPGQLFANRAQLRDAYFRGHHLHVMQKQRSISRRRDDRHSPRNRVSRLVGRRQRQ